MPSVVSAALAYLLSWFQSRHAMQLDILALRHQLSVYQHRESMQILGLRENLE
jgi:hypothetical protein